MSMSIFQLLMLLFV